MLKINTLYFEKGSQVSFLMVSLIIIGIVNMFFQVSPLWLYFNQTCCFQRGIRCAKRLKNCRLIVNFSIFGCFLWFWKYAPLTSANQLRITIILKDLTVTIYELCLFFKHFNSLIFSCLKNWIHTKHGSAIIVSAMFYHWLHYT